VYSNKQTKIYIKIYLTCILFFFFFLLDEIDSRLIELEKNLDSNIKEATEYHQKQIANDLSSQQLNQDLI
jgi:hypothetical protein